MKPIIGISSNLSLIDEGDLAKYEKITVRETYIKAVEKAGGVPVIIPVNTDIETIRRQVSLVDGILLSGGDDINPILYNQEPLANLGYVHPDVDEFDISLVKIALGLNKPIFGVCRGLQVLNVALGGTLYQDLSYIKESYINHKQHTKPYMGTHTIRISKNSMLENILGESSVVNSYHHQSIKSVGKNFKVTAVSKDNIIEAIELESDNFVVGVQWHPEYMVDYDEKMLDLFKLFISKCNK